MKRVWAWSIGILAMTMALRYAVVEPETIGQLCSSDGAPWSCGLRAVVIGIFASGTLGLVAIVAGVVATFSRSSTWALVALCLGIAGLVLYAFEAGAVACLLGGLVLARAVAAGRQPHAKREREA